MRIKKIGRIVLRILHGLIYAFLLLMGIGCMPSVMGAMFLMMAALATPKKVIHWLWEDPVLRGLWICLLFVCLAYVPEYDVEIAAWNMGDFLLPLWRAIQALFQK